MTTPKVKFENDAGGGQQPRQAGPGKGKKQKANQQGQAGGRPAYRSSIPELQDDIYSVGSTSFKATCHAIADYGILKLGLTADVAAAFREGKPVHIDKPARPTGTGTDNTPSQMDLLEYKMEYGEYMKRAQKARNAMESLFPVLLGQCDEYLRGKVKNRSDFTQLQTASDTIGLRRAIEEEGYAVNRHEFPYINALKCQQRIALLLDGTAETDGIGCGLKLGEVGPVLDFPS